MDLFEKHSPDWETLEQEIEKSLDLLVRLRAENEILVEKNRKLKEEKKAFDDIKKKMEKKIIKLIEKLSTIKE